MPATSKTPMTASSEAAAVIGMPWSWAASTKWVWIDRHLLESTALSVDQIAQDAGFGTAQ
ncbi:hypothetical protein STENM327S_02797 [Streptomyces tendae]